MHIPSRRRLLRAFIVSGVVGLAAVYLRAYALLIPLGVCVAFYLFSDSYDRMSAYLSDQPSVSKFLLSWLWALCVGLGVAAFVSHFVVSLTRLTIPGEGDALCLVYRLKYGTPREAEDPERYHRTERLGVMQRGDRALCETPEGPLALRLCALPGDSVQIIDNALFIGSDLADASQVTARYAICKRASEAMLQGILAAQVAPDTARVTPQQIERFRRRTPSPYDTVPEVRLPVQMRAQLWQDDTYAPLFANLHDARLYPYNVCYQWNAAQWGPLRLPRKGDEMALTLANVALYGPMVERWEHQRLEVAPDKHYSFRMSYCLCLNDDREVVNDSRLFGPLPEAAVVSRAYKLF